MKAFEQYIADLRVNLTLSPWAKEQQLFDWKRYLREEAEEVEQSEELDHTAEELGDVLGNWISAALVLEKKGGPAMETIIENARAKLQHRKPWLNDTRVEFPKTSPEEVKMIRERKKLEKKRGP